MKAHRSYRLVVPLLLAVPLLAATACTVRVVMPEVPATHPAHPDAASAPLPEPSPLLDSYRPVVPPPEMAPMDHHAMDHEAMDQAEEMEAEEQEAEPEEAEAPHRHHDPEPPPGAPEPGAP